MGVSRRSQLGHASAQRPSYIMRDGVKATLGPEIASNQADASTMACVVEVYDGDDTSA